MSTLRPPSGGSEGSVSQGKFPGIRALQCTSSLGSGPGRRLIASNMLGLESDFHRRWLLPFLATATAETCRQ